MSMVYLHGDLKEMFGGPYAFDVATPSEAVRAMCHQFKGFKKRLNQGYFNVVRSRRGKKLELGEHLLGVRLNNDCDLHITPVAAGSGKGMMKAILGVTILAAAFAFAPAAVGMTTMSGAAVTVSGGMGASVGFLGITYSQIAGFGAMMLLGGISSLLGGAGASGNTAAEVEANASYIFNGPVVSSKQGSAVPLVFGRFVCGAVVVSSDLVAERVASAAGATGSSGGMMAGGGGGA